MTHETVGDYRKSMKIALIITVVFLFVEIAGGLLSGSLALLSDAGHMFSDVFSLLLSLGAMTLALHFPPRSVLMVTIVVRSSQPSSILFC